MRIEEERLAHAGGGWDPVGRGERLDRGLLEHAQESCLLTTPTVNGYKRYQPNQMAPDRILWGKDNKGAMIRSCSTINAALGCRHQVRQTSSRPERCRRTE